MTDPEQRSFLTLNEGIEARIREHIGHTRAKQTFNPAVEGEFVIHLQPKLNIRTNKIIGAEALVRWHDPRIGMRMPGTFVAEFERNGLIADLDMEVFEQVCATLHEWNISGKHIVPLSINLSRTNVLNPDCIANFDAIRDFYGIPNSWLEFEISETFLLDGVEALTTIIDRIHRADFTCSIDHFGSHRASFSMLDKLEANALKLDRALFGGPYVETSQDPALAIDVIDVCKQLHLTAIAEGVETEDQLMFLQEVGCDGIQGFLLAAPMAVPDFEKFVELF